MADVKWEIVHDVCGERIRAFPVPGGWLFQVEDATKTYGLFHDLLYGWHPPVFVPMLMPIGNYTSGPQPTEAIQKLRGKLRELGDVIRKKTNQ